MDKYFKVKDVKVISNKSSVNIMYYFFMFYFVYLRMWFYSAGSLILEFLQSVNIYTTKINVKIVLLSVFNLNKYEGYPQSDLRSEVVTWGGATTAIH